MANGSRTARVLAGLLILSALWDGALAAVVFFRPEIEARAFGIAFTKDLALLAFIIGLLTTFFAGCQAVAAWQLLRAPRVAAPLVVACGAFLLACGLGFTWRLHQGSFLFVDSCRGLAMIALLAMAKERTP